MSDADPPGAGQRAAHRAVRSSAGPGRFLLGLLAAVVVLVLVAGVTVGVALSSPSLARSIGLPVDPVSVDAPSPVTFRSRLPAVGVGSSAPAADRVAAALDPRTAGLGRLTGTVVDPANGQVLWNRDAGVPQTPASSTKLLTTAAALLTLDPASRLATTVVAGPTPDSVVLVGGGDVTLSSLPDGQESVYPGAAHLDDLVAQVRAARAGQPVRTVYVDTGRYSGDALAVGWDPVDIAGGNLAPMVPVMLDGARLRANEVDGARSATPAQDAARELARRLAGGASGSADVAAGSAPGGAATLGRVESAPMTELVRVALQNSDNLLAEAIGREVARRSGAPASFAGAAGAVVATLRERGVDTTGVALSDTSGLSTADRIPAATLASVLAPAAAPTTADPRTAAMRPILDGLPVAGGGGTLADRYGAGTPSGPGRGWVRAKTGTLTAVNALAGLVTDADGRVLVFALMSNGADVTATRPRLDALAASLRGL